MCGRFVFQKGSHFYQQFEIELVMPDLFDSFNIAPTQIVPAIVLQDSKRTVLPCRWGLIPSWAKDISFGSRMINARSETLHEKPAFRTAFRKRRCLIPVSGFYEWQKLPDGRKQPLYIYLKNKEMFAFAGLWEEWHPKGKSEETVHSCTIITTSPNDFMARFHHRMPVILSPGDYDTWLDSGVEDIELLKALLKQYPADEMASHPVSTFVNSPQNNTEECIAPIIGE